VFLCEVSNRHIVCCLVHNGMTTKSDSTRLSSSLQCMRCRGTMQPLYIILDPTTGNHFRAFRCDCGERTLRYENSEHAMSGLNGPTAV
jgi:hypothetical protein